MPHTVAAKEKSSNKGIILKLFKELSVHCFIQTIPKGNNCFFFIKIERVNKSCLQLFPEIRCYDHLTIRMNK